MEATTKPSEDGIKFDEVQKIQNISGTVATAKLVEFIV